MWAVDSKAGVVHAAGVLSDGTITKQNRRKYEEVGPSGRMKHTDLYFEYEYVAIFHLIQLMILSIYYFMMNIRGVIYDSGIFGMYKSNGRADILLEFYLDKIHQNGRSLDPKFMVHTTCWMPWRLLHLLGSSKSVRYCIRYC